MHLIEIDRVYLQAAETVFAFPANRSGAESFSDCSFFIPLQSALRENVRTRAAPFLQRARDDVFGVAQAVDGRGVNPVDAHLQRAMNCGDGIGVVLRAPGKLPAAATKGPGTKADGRNLDIGIS